MQLTSLDHHRGETLAARLSSSHQDRTLPCHSSHFKMPTSISDRQGTLPVTSLSLSHTHTYELRILGMPLIVQLGMWDMHNADTCWFIMGLTETCRLTGGRPAGVVMLMGACACALPKLHSSQTECLHVNLRHKCAGSHERRRGTR